MSLPNPVRLTILWLGLALARAGVADRDRVRRTVDLAWPRVVTGLARMSKNAADAAMVGVAVGPVAIAGVGFAGPFWGLAFTVGGGLAAGTIALVSQRYGAAATEELGQAVRSSVLLVLVVTLPLTALFWTVPERLVGVLSSDAEAVGLGARYLGIVAFGVPFAGLNLVGSRVLIGADDAWTAMVVRGGGAVTNVGLNALFIFGLGAGVAGAALATVLANVVVTAAFVVGLVRGRCPLAGEFPVTVAPRGRYVDVGELRDLVRISLPVVGRNGVWTVARFPMLYIVGLFGPTVVAAYVISRRIIGLMNTPGWGFGTAASSLVGQSLGEDDETTAESFGREITLLSVATYVVSAALVAALVRPIVVLFVGDPAAPAVEVAVPLVLAGCVSMLGQGVTAAVAGSLDATGDTRWPFYGRALGMFGCSIPLSYLGATTALGVWGLYLGYVLQSFVPAGVNWYRWSTGKWKAISRAYRPESAVADD
ncbi:MAG: MATE family efflux transporter [Halolamina sp.]